MRKISVVIPVFRRKEHLKNTLEALNLQEGFRTSYEVIVVDDGSDDDIESYIQGVNTNYELKYYYLERCYSSGISKARNYGWTHSEGDIIAFIDADIIVKPDYIKEIERYFSCSKDIVVIGTRLMLTEDVRPEDIKNKSIYEKYSFSQRKKLLLEDRYSEFERCSYNMSSLSVPWTKVYGCNMVIHRKWLEESGGFDENFKGWGAEDIEFSYRIYSMGVQIVINSKLEVLHQYHKDSDIKPEKYLEYEKNVGYIISKHPHAHDFIPQDKIYDFYKGMIKNYDFSIMPKKPKKEEIIELRDAGDIKKIKEKILYLSNEENVKISVFDYIEDSDMDIWIQLLGPRKSTPGYYPVSKLTRVLCCKRKS